MKPGRRTHDVGFHGASIIEDGLRRGRSADAIQRDLAAAGVKVSPRTVSRRMADARGAVRVRRASSPRPVPVAPTQPADPYVADDEAIDRHVDALAELIDRRVDDAVSAELSDAESLADRWRNRAEVAGWRKCTSCGQHVQPEEDDDE